MLKYFAFKAYSFGIVTKISCCMIIITFKFITVNLNIWIDWSTLTMPELCLIKIVIVNNRGLKRFR